MPLIATDAVVLHTLRYGETSKIVRLMTRDHGLQSVIAKGAMSSRSNFGARLQILSEGIARFYLRPSRDLHTLREFEVLVQRPELATDVKRFVAGTALAELVLRFSPSEPHPEVYTILVHGLDKLGRAGEAEVDADALAALWSAVAVLGFAPSIAMCARDGSALASGEAFFSVQDGGFLCTRCAKGARAKRLNPSDRVALEHLIEGRADAIDALDVNHAAAHRRLLVQFIERHVSEGRDLDALTIWQSMS